MARTPPKSGIGIRAVAARAKVSISTVSRFLNGRNVNPDAAQRLLAAVEELGYQPDRVARSLRLRHTMTVAMVIPDITNPFFPAVVKGAEDTARAAGYALVLFNAGDDEEREWESLRIAQSMRCDGLLLIMAPYGPHHERRRRQLQELDRPVVYVAAAPDFPADMVVADDLHGSFEAVRYLVRLGHRHVAIIGGNPELSVYGNRLQGYREALRASDLEAPPQYEVLVAPTVDDGYSATARLLALPVPPTAIFAASYRLGIGTMSAIQTHGLRCPEDVSVIGYDQYDWQDVFHPRLTTVAQPTYLLGARAMDLLIRRMRTGPAPPESILLKSSLTARDSCCPPLPRL
ncbi:MAG TPA: LacI family DNA-binding transcriptional regulator [Vicinamibacteria bacterium]|nr:LacI family DNA-binding transcriptional regulator [Vicinamibacteria bacterium]